MTKVTRKFSKIKDVVDFVQLASIHGGEILCEETRTAGGSGMMKQMSYVFITVYVPKEKLKSFEAVLSIESKD